MEKLNQCFYHMKTTCLLLVWWVSITALYSQQVDTLDAYLNLERGDHYYREVRNFDSAFHYYGVAYKLFNESQFDQRAVHCLIRQGLCSYRQRNFELALKLFKRGLWSLQQLYPEDDLSLANPYSRLGSTYSAQGNYYQAQEYFKKTLELRQQFQEPGHIEIGVAQYNLGTAYMYYGEYQNGMQAYQDALEIYLNHYGESHRRLSSLYVNMGILYDKRGEPEKALEYYERSNKIDRELYGDQYYLLAYNYYNMAIAYVNLNQHDKALPYYKQTIELSDKNNLYQLLASAHYGLGNLAKHENDLDRSEPLYLKALDLFKEHFGPDHPGMNHSLRALADLWEKRGGYERSMEYLQQCLALLQKNYGERHPFIAKTLEQEAKLWSLQKNFTRALSTLDGAFNALMKRESTEMGTVGEFADQTMYLGLLRTRASILQEKYQHEGNLEELTMALQSFQQATDVLDQVRRGYMMDESKLFLQDEAFTTFEQGISCALSLFNETQDQDYLLVAHSFIEKSKATMLAEALQGNKLVKVQGVPDSLLQTEMDLKYQINYLESSIASAAESKRDSLEAHLFELRRSYDGLSQALAQNYPRYYDLKYEVEVVTPPQIQKELDENTAVLNYFIGDQHWYVFTTTKHRFTLHTVDLSTMPESVLEKFRTLLLDESTQGFTQSSIPLDLYQQLVEAPLSAHDSVDNLIVVPHGQLNHLPFDALLTSKGKPNQPLPYLVYRYAVSYTPSMTLKSSTKEIQEFKERYFGYAPDYEGEDLPRLRGSIDEVSHAKELFNGKQFVHQQATESSFKSNSDASKILHLAMHALVDDRDPMNSRLVFTSDSTGQDDGKLYAHEIYNLKLPSELAVLSACNTGFGEIARGEGIMNLSRAFQYAGSPNIVMSLWKAKDQPSAAIMRSFFLNIKNGLPKDKALQQAKIDYLKQADPFQSLPSQWATFVFVGDTTPMNFKSNLWSWIALGSLFIVLLVYFVRRSRR